jgi:hypothetical protein
MVSGAHDEEVRGCRRAYERTSLLYLQECVEARSRVRTGQRWDADVRVDGGKPGSSTRVWRLLDVDKHVDDEAAERGHHDTPDEKDSRDGSSGGVLRGRSP